MRYQIPGNCKHCNAEQKKFRTTARRRWDKFWTYFSGFSVAMLTVAIVFGVIPLLTSPHSNIYIWLFEAAMLLFLAPAFWRALRNQIQFDASGCLTVTHNGKPHLHHDAPWNDDKKIWKIQNSMNEWIDVRPIYLRVSLEDGEREATVHLCQGHARQWKITTFDHLSRFEFRDEKGGMRVWDHTSPRPLSDYLDFIERWESVTDFEADYLKLQETIGRMQAAFLAVTMYVDETKAAPRSPIIAEIEMVTKLPMNMEEFRGLPIREDLFPEAAAILVQWRKGKKLRYGPLRRLNRIPPRPMKLTPMHYSDSVLEQFD